ncbi:hypothetical protein BS47DRAFT_1361172 [Hydnum rufescens UP504]|uniref:TLC domain-containing protein n=1 Tax=Hydnum rufescens UP504 TaxID=1448309 RepID=A0A9P6B0V3_9AGAM|nr:hypothetical protein BS47DRAFT_1361172 [Hydnum rufescens UP504]
MPRAAEGVLDRNSKGKAAARITPSIRDVLIGEILGAEHGYRGFAVAESLLSAANCEPITGIAGLTSDNPRLDLACRPDMRQKKSSGKERFILPPLGLWSDLKTMAWMTVPMSSFKMLLIPVVLWTNWHFLAPHIPNPFASLLFVSYPVADSDPGSPRFAKGPLVRLIWDGGQTSYSSTYYVIVWSFVRQFLTLHILRPLAIRLGYVMSQLPTWWFQTEHFWIEYPHWRMTPLLKRYYLMQFAYWFQQLLVLVLRLEKPRKDFSELVIHHIVTIWLVFWSYTINLTYIGNAKLFMKSGKNLDILIGLHQFAKLCNYLRWEKAAAVAFATFVCVWTYLRHFLNIKIIWSVWTQWKNVPEYSKHWGPKEGVWMLWCAVFGPGLEDERSDDEGEGEDVHTKDE